MPIIKSKQASDYTILPNAIFRSGISIESIGLLAYLLNLPHDWILYKTTLHKKIKMGKEKLDRLFKELQDAGFIISVKKVDKEGKFTYEHVVYDRAFNGEPYTGLPYTDEPLTDEPLTVNPPALQYTDTKETLTKETISNDRFEEFWELYDYKVGKQKARIAWNNLSEKEKTQALALVPTYKECKPDKQYRKQPEGFIHNKYWNDEVYAELMNNKMPETKRSAEW